MDFLQQAELFAPELTALRHALHRKPELGNHEFATAQTVEQFLRACGLETVRLLDTAVLGILRGAKPGGTVVLRADMDALPVQEQTLCAFSSENPGCMHACGHDVHMAVALGAAKLLSERRDALCGTVKFLFQPDEEGDGGAERLLAAGALDGADAVFGCHVSPELPAGTAGFRYGKFYAASNPFTARVYGKSAHGAEPEKGVDALYAAAKMAAALKELQAPLSEKNGKTVLSICTLHSGTANNILADYAEFSGMLRTLGADSRRDAVQSVRDTTQQIAAQTGVRLALSIRDGYPGVVNDDGMTALAEAAAKALLGDQRVLAVQTPTMTTEDFGYYLQTCPGAFYWLGTGGEAALHNPNFLPSDGILPTGAALNAAILWEYLNK